MPVVYGPYIVLIVVMVTVIASVGIGYFRPRRLRATGLRVTEEKSFEISLEEPLSKRDEEQLTGTAARQAAKPVGYQITRLTAYYAHLPNQRLQFVSGNLEVHPRTHADIG
ncbi:hypothetical protein [Salinisphaera sp. Q1T1-3]|uniref:hypothetical protein n=1 Tax=Salinisphaera sp. Q1T1-3 TaxID=2321229 RepID=UPI000E743057|nr:hypothetical protein [Salinisphaera sp. Q1T1-3]RJS95288.1 hypothetical protein D3260_01680 [Salinisphaera sp. Q1T1-3]